MKTLKKYVMRVRGVDRQIFNLIKSGRKKVETRAAGPKYEHIKEGDILVFRCGKDRFEKRILKRRKFRTIGAMLKKYKVSDIHPFLKNRDELNASYRSFPGYDERIKKYGLLAFEFYKK